MLNSFILLLCFDAIDCDLPRAVRMASYVRV